MIQGCPEHDYGPVRDISDFLLMRYALAHDIHMLCICRGMQAHPEVAIRKLREHDGSLSRCIPAEEALRLFRHFADRFLESQ